MSAVGRGALALLILVLAWGGCDDSGSDGEAPRASPSLSPGQARVRTVDHFLINYGFWDDAKIDVARSHQLVVVHPKNGNLTRRDVEQIQQGADPASPHDDVLVLGYISVGEDLRTRHVTDAEMLHDPRFAGDRTGPRVDPRGPGADGQPLDGINPLGAPSSGGGGYASWYLDDNSMDRFGAGDGKPDRNAVFGGCFVNAGDPKWFDVANSMRQDGPDGVAGLREIMTTTYGRGFGCDGVFLDTLDTCAPNSFTDSGSPNQSEFEWTAPGFRDFIRRVRAAYPDRIILQNRGLFFFDPRHPHYRFTTRGVVDVVLFESFRLNSNTFEEYSPYFYADNLHNIAPKLMAEAGRPDGFRVVSLGYAEGPPDQISKATLTGGSTLGLETLLEDIRVTERVCGFRHYLSDGAVELVNRFVHDHADRSVWGPPAWSSTWNANTPGPPDPRVGIQEAVAGAGSITVRWDVALDLNPPRYFLYLQTAPFDFLQDPALSSARRVELRPSVGKGYERGGGPDVFPYEARIGGLQSGVPYYLVIRAANASHEDSNQAVLSATPR